MYLLDSLIVRIIRRRKNITGVEYIIYHSITNNNNSRQTRVRPNILGAPLLYYTTYSAVKVFFANNQSCNFAKNPSTSHLPPPTYHLLTTYHLLLVPGVGKITHLHQNYVHPHFFNFVPGHHHIIVLAKKT